MATFMASWMGGGAVAGSINSIAYTAGLWPSILYASGSILAIVILYAIGPLVRKRGKITTAAAAVVLDADGINALGGHIDVLDARRDRITVLTPHDGEFTRIGVSSSMLPPALTWI